MLCPKCGHESLSDLNACERCGVIFAKIHPNEGAKSPVSRDVKQEAEPSESPRNLFLALLFTVDTDGNVFHLVGRFIALLILAIWGGKLIFAGVDSNAAGESWLHLVNLPFHEAGHVLFRPFGRFMTALGGTLGQLLVPLICMLTLLLKTRDPFGAAVCFWWFGENFLDIAPYLDDARAGSLPLLGGNFGHAAPYGFHDWEYLLTETGLLRADHALAMISQGSGSLLMILAVFWGGALLRIGLKNTNRIAWS